MLEYQPKNKNVNYPIRRELHGAFTYEKGILFLVVNNQVILIIVNTNCWYVGAPVSIMVESCETRHNGWGIYDVSIVSVIIATLHSTFTRLPSDD